MRQVQKIFLILYKFLLYFQIHTAQLFLGIVNIGLMYWVNFDLIINEILLLNDLFLECFWYFDHLGSWESWG